MTWSTVSPSMQNWVLLALVILGETRWWQLLPRMKLSCGEYQTKVCRAHLLIHSWFVHCIRIYPFRKSGWYREIHASCTGGIFILHREPARCFVSNWEDRCLACHDTTCPRSRSREYHVIWYCWLFSAPWMQQWSHFIHWYAKCSVNILPST